MTPCECGKDTCDPCAEIMGRLVKFSPKMLTVLQKIAYEPFGDAEATDRQVLDAITALARSVVSEVEDHQ